MVCVVVFMSEFECVKIVLVKLIEVLMFESEI